MEYKKTKIEDFINYLDDNRLSSERLLNILKRHTDDDGYFCGYKSVSQFIEDISDYSFLKLPSVGEKALLEFKKLKNDHLPIIQSRDADCELETDNNSETCNDNSREKFSFWLRSDIVKKLKTFENRDTYVERAILEQFDRDRFLRYFRLNEETS